MRRSLLILATGVAGLVVAVVAGWVGVQWWNSRLPSTYDPMAYARADYGGGPALATHETGMPMPPGMRMAPSAGMPELVAAPGIPDKRFVLTARQATVRLPSGRRIDALTFDGVLPGPELHVRVGDLVQVTLVNRDIGSGVTIHWHGVDVPAAEDGVAGVTQNAVPPHGRFVYRFRPDRAGTFWYHAHQVSASEVRRGLFGVLVVEPREAAAHGALDLALASHDFDGTPTLAGSDVVRRRTAPRGAPVRLRLVNTDNTPQRFTLDGTSFRVLALDGNDVVGPTPMAHRSLRVAAGGRVDLGFTMPATPVRLSVADTKAALVLSGEGGGELPASPPGPDFDPIAYGTRAPTPFGLASHFDRRFRLSIGRKPGFLDGHPGMQWTLNGGIYPRVPMFMVREGDLVEMTVENHTSSVHPMHLHGHRMLVLSRNGVVTSGSPWWTDTLDVEPGQRYELAFRADNPGIWMDHCHNLAHASDGLTMHLAYEGVTTPYRIGGSGNNRPE
jgi:FtsP/CotA-like multicopper oxidase with cupredoxin domain